MTRVILGTIALIAITLAGADSASTSTSASTDTAVPDTRPMPTGVGSVPTSLTSMSADLTAPPQPDYVFCSVCHGAQGNGNPAIDAPKIAGIEPWYLRQQLLSFRAGMRGTKPTDVPGMQMQPVGVELDDTEIDAVIAWVAKFEAIEPPVTVRGNAKQGRALYASCSGCHGSRAEGNSALQAPALAGQTDWYLVRQLERFRNGERGYAAEDIPGSTMRAAVAVLPDSKAVNDLVAYINTLPAKRRGT